MSDRESPYPLIRLVLANPIQAFNTAAILFGGGMAWATMTARMSEIDREIVPMHAQPQRVEQMSAAAQATSGSEAMAQTMTFTTLRGELADAFERGQSETTDPVVYEKIPRCINRAERRIAFDLKVQGQQQAVVSAFVSGTPVVQKPGNWLRTISLNFGSCAGNATRTIIYPRA